jgi:hypothetical protein
MQHGTADRRQVDKLVGEKIEMIALVSSNAVPFEIRHDEMPPPVGSVLDSFPFLIGRTRLFSP